MTARTVMVCLKKHSLFVALTLFGLGCGAWGFCIASVRDDTIRSTELAANMANFREALDAKDKYIGSLIKATITATGQAADAVDTAAVAAGVATKAAAVASKKSNSDDAELNKLRKDQKPKPDAHR